MRDTGQHRGIQFDLLYPSWSADDLVILASNRPRSLRGKRQWTDLPEAQGSRHARESKSGIPEIFLLVESGILDILMEEFGILGFGIRNTRRGIQNPGLSWIPLCGTTRRCSHHRCSAKLEFIDDLISFIWAALLAMKKALGEIFYIKVRLGKVWGVFSIPQRVARLKPAV